MTEMSKRRVYVVPMVRLYDVQQENLLGNPTSWNDGHGTTIKINEGNPDEEDLYSKESSLFDGWSND